MIRAYLTTALCMLILGSVGLATARDLSLTDLNIIFYFAFLPSVAAGMLVFFARGLKAQNQAEPAGKTRLAEKAAVPARPYRAPKA